MINITEKAVAKLKKTLAEKGLPATAGVRFAVKGGGCSGFEYDIQLVEKSRFFDLPKRGDNVYTDHDIRVVIDDKSLMFLKGMTVDFEENDFGFKFVFRTPNAAHSCGCGVSFTPYE